MEDFIHQSNIQLFLKRLAEAKDDPQREIIRRLLAEETAKSEPPKKSQ